MSDRDNVFGDDRDDEPGITEEVGRLPAQVTDWMSESAAMHSRSRGWLPAVIVRIATDDGAGIVCSIEVGSALDEIITNLRLASRRARADVAVARQRGDLP